MEWETGQATMTHPSPHRQCPFPYNQRIFQHQSGVLPPNTTSKLQPLDQRIICLQVQYHTILNNKLVQMLENEKDVK